MQRYIPKQKAGLWAGGSLLLLYAWAGLTFSSISALNLSGVIENAILVIGFSGIFASLLYWILNVIRLKRPYHT